MIFDIVFAIFLVGMAIFLRIFINLLTVHKIIVIWLNFFSILFLLLSNIQYLLLTTIQIANKRSFKFLDILFNLFILINLRKHSEKIIDFVVLLFQRFLIFFFIELLIFLYINCVIFIRNLFIIIHIKIIISY